MLVDRMVYGRSDADHLYYPILYHHKYSFIFYQPKLFSENLGVFKVR